MEGRGIVRVGGNENEDFDIVGSVLTGMVMGDG
jgi:hypothetical protein